MRRIALTLRHGNLDISHHHGERLREIGVRFTVVEPPQRPCELRKAVFRVHIESVDGITIDNLNADASALPCKERPEILFDTVSQLRGEVLDGAIWLVGILKAEHER